MKKFFLSIVLLISSSIYVFSAETEVYCYSPSSAMVFKHTDFRENPTTPFCESQIPKSVYDKIDRENDDWFQKGSVKDPDASIFSSAPLRNNPKFIQQRKQAIENIYNQSKSEVSAFNKSMEIDFQKKQNEINEKQKVSKLLELERKHSAKCNIGYVKGSEKYKNCLIKEENKSIVEKNKLDLEAKQISEKLSKMSPDDRRAYTCSEKFGFRKGSDNFKECVFKIYSAEIELEKIELQKQLAKANADLAKANAASNEKLANAQTNAAIMQAYAAQQQAIAANTADSLALMESGLRMMSPQRPASRAPMNCQYHAKMLSCF